MRSVSAKHTWDIVRQCRSNSFADFALVQLLVVDATSLIARIWCRDMGWIPIGLGNNYTQHWTPTVLPRMTRIIAMSWMSVYLIRICRWSDLERQGKRS